MAAIHLLMPALNSGSKSETHVVERYLQTISILLVLIITTHSPALGQLRDDAPKVPWSTDSKFIELMEATSLSDLVDWNNAHPNSLLPIFTSEEWLPRFHEGWQKWNLAHVPIPFLAHLADKGDPFAQANMGIEYMLVRHNWCLGQYWLAQAGRQKHSGVIYWIVRAYLFGFGAETQEERIKNAYLWTLQWSSVLDILGDSVDFNAEVLGIDDEKRDEYFRLFKSLDVSELPSPPKQSCAYPRNEPDTQE